MSKGFKIMAGALLLSVALNVFAVGFMLGRGGLGDRPSHGRDVSFSPRSLARLLPEEERRTLRAAMKARQPDLAQAVRQMRDARRQVARLLRAEVLDSAAMADALGQWASAELALRQGSNAAMIEALSGLDQEQRIALVDRLERRRFRREGDGPPPPQPD